MTRYLLTGPTDVERDLEDISRLTDWDLVAKAHKEKKISDRKAPTSLLIL